MKISLPAWGEPLRSGNKERLVPTPRAPPFPFLKARTRRFPGRLSSLSRPTKPFSIRLDLLDRGRGTVLVSAVDGIIVAVGQMLTGFQTALNMLPSSAAR
jgi:hypothetical protein